MVEKKAVPMGKSTVEKMDQFWAAKKVEKMAVLMAVVMAVYLVEH